MAGLVAVCLVFGSPGIAGPRPVPAAIPEAVPAVPIDLAAMTLVPGDLPTPPDRADSGFGLAGGGKIALSVHAARLARARGRGGESEVAALAATLAAAGWRGHHESRLAAPDTANPGGIAATVESAVTEYAGANGAAAAFALLAETPPGSPGRSVRGLVPLGDESRIVRTPLLGAASGPSPARLELTVRLGSLLAVVAVADLAGDRDWGVRVLEGLAAELVVRVEAVRAAGPPGLAPRLLRLEAPGLPAPEADGYDRRGGVTFPLFGVDPDDAADRDGLYGAAVDVYAYEQALAAGAPRRVPAFYAVKLYRFPDAIAAAAWLADAPERLLADPGSFLDLALVDDAATLGDASRTLAYAFPVDEAATARGHRVYARLGNEVARVQLDGDPEVPLGVVEAFARAQLACLAAPACATPPPIPVDALVPAVPSTP